MYWCFPRNCGADSHYILVQDCTLQYSTRTCFPMLTVNKASRVEGKPNRRFFRPLPIVISLCTFARFLLRKRLSSKGLKSSIRKMQALWSLSSFTLIREEFLATLATEKASVFPRSQRDICRGPFVGLGGLAKFPFSIHSF